jgi:hypothetical protein
MIFLPLQMKLDADQRQQADEVDRHQALHERMLARREILLNSEDVLQREQEQLHALMAE